MSTTIFISLPVAAPKKSVSFYEALGYKANPQFSDPSGEAGCIDISDTIAVMFLTEEQFQKISPKPMSDPKKFCQVLLSLTCGCRPVIKASAV